MSDVTADLAAKFLEVDTNSVSLRSIIRYAPANEELRKALDEDFLGVTPAGNTPKPFRERPPFISSGTIVHQSDHVGPSGIIVSQITTIANVDEETGRAAECLVDRLKGLAAVAAKSLPDGYPAFDTGIALGPMMRWLIAVHIRAGADVHVWDVDADMSEKISSMESVKSGTGFPTLPCYSVVEPLGARCAEALSIVDVPRAPTPYLGISLDDRNREAHRDGFGTAYFHGKDKPWKLFAELVEAGNDGVEKADLMASLDVNEVPLRQHKANAEEVIMEPLRLTIVPGGKGPWKVIPLDDVR